MAETVAVEGKVEMVEGGRDEAKLFVTRFMGRMTDVMLERALELDFENDPLLEPVRQKLKALKTTIVNYTDAVRGW
jgi:hypothetical protein